MNGPHFRADQTIIGAFKILPIYHASINRRHNISIVITTRALLRDIQCSGTWLIILRDAKIFTLNCGTKRSTPSIYDSSTFTIGTLWSNITLININVILKIETFLRLLLVIIFSNIGVIKNLSRLLYCIAVWYISCISFSQNYTTWIILLIIMVYCVSWSVKIICSLFLL